MLLDTNKHTIKYVAVDYYCSRSYWDNTYVEKKNFDDYIRLANFGTYPENTNYRCTYSTYNSKDNLSPIICKGVFLGDDTTIKSQLAQKQNPANPSTFKKVYFDPSCKYPRFKLSSLTNIKRCLDPAKADSVIISEPNFNNYVCKARPLGDTKHDGNVLVFFSPKEDSYYFIDYYPEHLHNKQENQRFQLFLRSKATPLTTGLRAWASALLNSHILPSDCIEIYYGKVILTQSLENIETINNLLTKYMLITYDTELDRFISNGLQKVTPEDLETLGRMFSSDDTSVVGMAIKLLSNYDLLSSACAVGSLIAQHWFKLNQCSASNSIGFKQAINTLKLDITALRRGNNSAVIDTLYSVSSDDTDKENARNMIKEKLTRTMDKEWKKLNDQFPSMNFTFNFTIE